MDKSKLALSDAVEHYLIACQTEGKSPKALKGYREKLTRYLNDVGGTVGEFTIENVRAHIVQLQRAPRWGGLRGAADGVRPLAPESVLDHVRILKGLATWLFEEGYTNENVLQRLQRPKAPSSLIEILDDDEVRRVLAICPFV
jgi:site-specific recombinase XerD